MDFSDFDSRGASDEGRPYHLLHPVTSEPMMDGDTPCVVMVRGVEGRDTQEALRKIESARVKDEKPDVDELDARIKASAAVLLVGFKSGVHRGSKPAKVPADVDWFLDLNRINMNLPGKSFAEQIAKAAADRGMYLGNVSAD